MHALSFLRSLSSPREVIRSASLYLWGPGGSLPHLHPLRSREAATGQHCFFSYPWTGMIVRHIVWESGEGRGIGQEGGSMWSGWGGKGKWGPVGWMGEGEVVGEG